MEPELAALDEAACLLPRPRRSEGTDTYWVVPPQCRIAAPAGWESARYLVEKLVASGIAAAITDAPGDVSITFECSETSHPPEGYDIAVRAGGVTIGAGTDTGAFYAVQTLLQMLPPEIFRSEPQAGVEWQVPCGWIEDAPRFRWRGLHLDCARHFFPVAFILRLLDLLALHKLNVFHWHLTDDQGWRFPSETFPLLTEIGAWRAETVENGGQTKPLTYDGVPHGGFYTPADISAIVAYAAARHITVVPEIEMPGHATAALAAYPHLGCTGERPEVARTFGILPHALCPGNDEVLDFIEAVLDEVIALFPSPFIHIGGDECEKGHWIACPKCQARIQQEGLADETELQSWFVSRVASFLKKRGRTLIGWDEILEGGLAREVAVMNWRGAEHAVEAVKKGAEIVMSPMSHVYLDFYQSRDEREPRAINDRSVTISLERVHDFDPLLPSLTEAESGRILGGQANVWTEFMPVPNHVEYMIFPRLCALAENVWSPREGKSFDEFSRRLTGHLARLDALKVNYRRPNIATSDPHSHLLPS